MPADCEWSGGCANDPHHQVPDGVPVYAFLKINSNEIDGYYCRIHGTLRARQMGRELRAFQRTAATAAREASGDE